MGTLAAMAETSQLHRWKGSMGDAYLARNPPRPEHEQRLVAGWQTLLSHMVPRPRSVLEVGAANGLNLRALQRLGGMELWAVEPNEQARAVLADEVLEPSRVLDGTLAELPLDDGSVELAYTSGVLIHVPDEQLEQAYRELHRVSSRWLVSLEYFAPVRQDVTWHGEEDILFKRDYGAPWLDLFDDVRPAADGWFWNRTTGLGDLTWWIFEKRA
jgi:spore coat polysaccharide biosynthesis protein SpsF